MARGTEEQEELFQSRKIQQRRQLLARSDDNSEQQKFEGKDLALML